MLHHFHKQQTMEILEILMIGGGTGMVLSMLSIAIINSSNAEQYPLGGFMPALWMVFDLGGSSQLVEGGCLVLGGMLGYYFILFLWGGQAATFRGLIPEKHGEDPKQHENTSPSDETSRGVITGKKLTDFL